MYMKKAKPIMFVLLICAVLLGGCRSDVDQTAMPVEPKMEATATTAATATLVPIPTPANPTPTTIPGPTPTFRPLTTSAGTTDPAAAMGDYMAEGLFISHFDADDIAAWQGYSQDTEITVPEGKTPPEGYLKRGWLAR